MFEEIQKANEELNGMTLDEMQKIVNASTREKPVYAYVCDGYWLISGLHEGVHGIDGKKIILSLHYDGCVAVNDAHIHKYLKGNVYFSDTWRYFKLILPKKVKRVMTGKELHDAGAYSLKVKAYCAPYVIIDYGSSSVGMRHGMYYDLNNPDIEGYYTCTDRTTLRSLWIEE